MRGLLLWIASQDESQPCPQCVHCRPLMLLICFRRHQELGDYYLFPSIDLNYAGLSIMYNLSYNTSQDIAPPQLHFNLMPLVFSFSVRVWSVYDPAKVGLCCVQQVCFDILRPPPVRITPLSARSPPPPLLFPSKNLVRRTVLSPPSSRASRTCIRWKCYKPNKNVLPLDSPTVNI